MKRHEKHTFTLALEVVHSVFVYLRLFVKEMELGWTVDDALD